MRATLCSSHTNARARMCFFFFVSSVFSLSFSLRILFTFLKIEMFSSLPRTDWSKIASFRVRIVRAYWTIGHESRCVFARALYTNAFCIRYMYILRRTKHSSCISILHIQLLMVFHFVASYFTLFHIAHSDWFFQVGGYCAMCTFAHI